MSRLFACAILILVSQTPTADSVRESAHAQKTLEIYRKIISIPTVAGRGKVPEMAEYLVSELGKAGFQKEDLLILPKDETAALVVRYRGDGSAGKKPILLLAHMDVVEALPEDWERPPFALTEDETFFYGRGTIDNKYGVSLLTSTFIRLRQEGFIPTRDLVIVFSGDEETGMLTTRMLAHERKDLTDAEFALNTDSAGGTLNAEGKPLDYLVQAAEKTYVTFELTVRNPGGHSSRPRPDNAIYDLMAALGKIQQYRFPVMQNEITRNYFRVSGQKLGGELGNAMIRFADDPGDTAAAQRLAHESSYVGNTRTTCVPTMLRAGHAENALPQSATATVNCRIFPGVGVATVKQVLQEVVGNDAVAFVTLGDPVESPVSELRDDVMGAVRKAVDARSPGLSIMTYMSTGGTDGMHFRAAGVPTFATSSIFMNPDDNYAHGLNERLPIESFYGGLDHWVIILKELAGRK